jgi:2-oxoglutarate ferredoxin oxidoreductase subunit gamma
MFPIGERCATVLRGSAVGGSTHVEGRVVEREILFTGIGGQGIQLMAKTLAAAAALDGLSSMMFGVYSGSMRGSNSDATVVVGTTEVRTPPTVVKAWSAVVMHDQFWDWVNARLQPGGVLVLDNGIVQQEINRDDLTLVGLPASEMAVDLGSPASAGLIATAAYVKATGIVTLESLRQAAAAALPPYRAHHVDANDRAIIHGYEAVEAVVAAWPEKEMEGV